MISCDEFVKRLSDSELLSRDDLQAVQGGTGDAAGVPDARALASSLIEACRLTSFQSIENVLTSRTGREALELAKRGKTDVVLSSMQLPDMTGMQLAQALHDDPRCSRVGFVLASSDCQRIEVSRTPDSPMIVLLPKPFTLRPPAQSLAQATGRVLDEPLR
jgi:CheY-like chemotaxis protein